MPNTEPNREYGRIRLYEESSALLKQILLHERDLILLGRKYRADGEETHEYNKRVQRINQMLGELARMRLEKGWHDDQEGRGTQSTEEESESVG